MFTVVGKLESAALYGIVITSLFLLCVTLFGVRIRPQWEKECFPHFFLVSCCAWSVREVGIRFQELTCVVVEEKKKHHNRDSKKVEH